MVIDNLLLGLGNFSENDLLDHLVVLHELSIFHHEVKIMHFVKHLFFFFDFLFRHVFLAVTIDFFFESFFKFRVSLNILCFQCFFELGHSHVIELEVLIFANVNAVEDRVLTHFIYINHLDEVDAVNQLLCLLFSIKLISRSIFRFQHRLSLWR